MVVDERVQGGQLGRRMSGDPGGESSGLQYGHLAFLPGQFPGAGAGTAQHVDSDERRRHRR